MELLPRYLIKEGRTALRELRERPAHDYQARGELVVVGDVVRSGLRLPAPSFRVEPVIIEAAPVAVGVQAIEDLRDAADRMFLLYIAELVGHADGGQVEADVRGVRDVLRLVGVIREARIGRNVEIYVVPGVFHQLFEVGAVGGGDIIGPGGGENA